MFRPLGDELLLVDEAHRAQVLGAERRLQIRPLWNGLSQQSLKYLSRASSPGLSSARSNAAIRERTAAGTRAASSFDVFRNSLRCGGSSDSTSVRALTAGSIAGSVVKRVDCSR